MARLNEPAPATETMDSLKRKFMRQNRDIARANSTQSLRIRNLENEISRMLAENLDLREQIIRMQKEIDEGPARRAADNATEMRAQIESKLLELGSLVATLGESGKPRARSPRAGRIIRTSTSSSPDQRKWKNMCTLSEAVAGQDGRLPPILENKSYPRRTLDRQEIAELIADADVDTTESPELGPPPVSQFVDQDPVKIDLPRRPKKDVEETFGFDPVLSVNLEHRKKRKDSTVAMEPKETREQDLPTTTKDVEVPVKIGAKRKLSVREDDENDKPAVPPSPDNFKFTRVKEEEKPKTKSSTQQEKANIKPIREIAVPRGSSREKVHAPTTTRKALASRSVNSSPRKNGKGLLTDGGKPIKGDIFRPGKPVEQLKDILQEALQVPLPPELPNIQSVETPLEPETPAALDLFSPQSSQPSTARVESRDTPPPTDLATNTEGQRPSRRARGAVSYAEPNLRDKMRRPTKDLTDAVLKDGSNHRLSVTKSEDGPGVGGVGVKSEPEADDAWKSMSAASMTTVENSPLSSKAPESLPSTITTHRNRRESSMNKAEVEPARSTSGSAIAALLAESRRARAGATDISPRATNGLAKDIEKLDVGEGESSPTLQTNLAGKEAKEERPALRFTRKHPSIPRDVAPQSDSEASDMDVPKAADKSKSRRRQSTLGLGSSATNPKSSKTSESYRSLTRSTSAVTPSEAASESRNDRMSSRRRSMML